MYCLSLILAVATRMSFTKEHFLMQLLVKELVDSAFSQKPNCSSRTQTWESLLQPAECIVAEHHNKMQCPV